MGIHIMVPLFGLVTGELVTAVFYPDANPETTSIDGRVGRTGGGLTWSDIRDGAGNSMDSTTDYGWVEIRSYTSTNKWYVLRRMIFLFDTSSIPPWASIVSVKFDFWLMEKVDELGCAPRFAVCSSNPASNTTLTIADYGTIGDSLLSNEINYADLVVDQYNELTLNGAGRAAIAKVGITKLAIRESRYDAPNVAPGWSHFDMTRLKIRTAEAVPTKEPRLTVAYRI